MATIWSGALSFGLVHIPVQLHSAVRRAERVSFRLLHKKDRTPIKNRRVCPREDVEVAWQDIVKGYEVAKGQFVILDPQDFEKAAVTTSKRVDVLEFVSSEGVDPRFFETPYYLVPQPGGEKPYALFREALERTGTLGIGKFTLRQRQHLVAVQPMGDALVLHLMRFQNELVNADDFSFPRTDDVNVRPQELEMAEQLIRNLSEEFDPGKYHDEYTENLREIIRAKAEGEEIEMPEVEEPEGTKVIDLMSRLRESLDRADELRQERQSAAEPTDAEKPGGRKRARKTSGKKSAKRKRSVA